MTDLGSDTDQAGSTAREVFDRAKRLALAKDLAGFAGLFAADGVFEAPFAPLGASRRIEGRDALREHFSALSGTPLKHTGFRDMTVYQTDDPEVVIAEYDAYGEVTGTGQPYQLRYLQLVRVRDGEIVLWRDYWDPLAGAQLLGRVQLLERYAAADAEGDRG
jgi:ketosteroid isomerase-like protein